MELNDVPVSEALELPDIVCVPELEEVALFVELPVLLTVLPVLAVAVLVAVALDVDVGVNVLR